MLILTLAAPMALLTVLPYMDRLERWVSMALQVDRAPNRATSSDDVEDPS